MKKKRNFFVGSIERKQKAIYLFSSIIQGQSKRSHVVFACVRFSLVWREHRLFHKRKEVDWSINTCIRKWTNELSYAYGYCAYTKVCVRPSTPPLRLHIAYCSHVNSDHHHCTCSVLTWSSRLWTLGSRAQLIASFGESRFASSFKSP